MPILYSVISRGSTVLAKHASCAGNFAEVTEQIIEKIPSYDNKLTYSHGNYLFHYVCESKIVYMCITDDEFERSRAFLFLNEIKRRFQSTYGSHVDTAMGYAMNSEFSSVLANEMKHYSESHDVDTISKVHGELDELKHIMVKNIDNITMRGEHIELLINKTENLSNNSVAFRKTSHNLARSLFWKNVKLYVILALIILVIIYIIVSLSCGGLLWQSCLSKNWPTIPAQNVSGGSRSSALGGGDPLLPSPASPSAIIVSPETLSHRSTPSKPAKQSVQIATTPREMMPGPMAIAPMGYHYGYPPPFPVMRRQSLAERQSTWRQLGADALATTLSALYGKLLVVMGTAFPMAEVISTYIPPSFYEVYYLYLYIGSMFFLLYMYTMLLKDKRQRKKDEEAQMKANKSGNEESISDSGEESDRDSGETTVETASSQIYRPARRGSLSPSTPKQYHYGSFYLRMGAVAFGIGSMIYSGLEFGQYFELETNTKCHNVLLALTPATRMAFIFIQMYFIFLNNEQMKVYKHKLAARFGLMHMIGTNLSVWLNVLVQETKHEILTFYNPENNSLRISHRMGAKNNVLIPEQFNEHHTHHIVARGLKGPHRIYECRRTNVLGTLVQDASPFLFPCTIEYSLICAAILYVMWKSISKSPIANSAANNKFKSEFAYRKSPHHYSVDCARAHKGLFLGILLLVLTIISLILFFVLISRSELSGLAVIEVNICELTLYGMSTLATIGGMWQVRQLKFDGSRNIQLDNILLIGAQTGMYIYSMFTIIGGQFTIEKNTILVLITALASLLQTTFQTIFVLDASRRSCVTPEQIRRKPGREIVTFLLVTNLAMWLINTLEKSRADSHPIQLHFYGLWAWTIITHVSMPLAIFYRFHSTVCLCEIWKRAYKIKPTYM